jgi:hypothetical protein
MMAALAAPAAARAADDAKTDKPVVDEILAILKERGDIDEGEYQRLVAKNAEHEKKEGWIDRVRIFGDLRSRYEGFWYDKDELSNFPNRFRGRYRARLGAEAPINDYVSAVMRIATSEGDNRSENQSFGRNAPDFNYDGVVWDWGYIQFKSKEGQLPAGGIALAQAGKTPNPFIGHFGREKMLWDPDITLEGAIVKLSAAPWKDVKLFANGGYSIIDENWAPVGENKDPNLITAQLGAEWKLLRDWSTGARFTWFGFRSLDPSFVQRGVNGSTASGAATNSAGNIPDGLTGNVNGGHMGVGEIQAYLTWSGLEAWPVTIAGGMSDNFSAQASQLFPGVGRDAFAWNAGIEFGDKAQWVQLGATYYWVEANAFPSMYIDSDTLDGITNRKGWAFTGTRQLFTNTDLSLSLFSSDSINATLPGEQFSIPGSQRFRLQADVEVKF